MKLNEAVNYIRAQVNEGKRLQAKACPHAREIGTKQVWRARRIARRLGYRNITVLCIDL